MRTYTLTLGILFLALLQASCGGNGQSQPPPPPPPGFTIVLSTSSITLTQGGSSQNVQVQVFAENGFTGSVAVTASGLPAGVTVSPAPLSVTPSVAGTLTFAASSTAGIAQTSATVTGVSGSLTANAPLQFNVSAALAPVPDPFHLIGGEFSHGFYDQTRQLLFVANLALNEVDVISGVDFSMQARVPAPQPWGVDQMADGNTLVVGTLAQQIVTLDETTLTVTSHPVPALGTVLGLFYPNVVALANGKVLMIGQEEGIDSNDILDGGQYLIEWDSINDTFEVVEPASDQFSWETDSLARSADHKWAIFSADQFYLYSSDTDSFTTASLNTVNPPQDEYDVRGYAINADGTKIAVASALQATFLDGSFNVLATTAIPYAFQNARTAVMFTPDSNRLLIQYDLPLAIEVLDANSYTELGYYSGVVTTEDNDERLMAADSSGRAFVAIAGGVRVVDMTAPIIANPVNGLPGATCAQPSPDAAPLNSGVQGSLNAIPPDGTNYYFGGQPAPVLSGGTQIEIPASASAGPVDIECIGPDGNNLVFGVAFSYGVDPIGVSANFIPPTGNTSVYITGFGFSATPAISVGGQSVTTLAIGNPDSNSLQIAQVQVPNGTPGGSASVAVTSANGSGSLAQAMTYIPSATILPSSGLLQVLYDSHRNLVYALQATEVDVLNPSTLQWQSPLPIPGAGPSVTYNMMALSPDGSWLAVASPSGYVAVIDPDNPAQASSVATNSTPGVSIAISEYNKAILTGTPNVEVDLASLKVTPIPGLMGMLVRASADGTHLYGADLNISSGQVYAIDPVTYSVQQPPQFAYLFWSDLTVSPDGSQFAAIAGAPYAAGDFVGFYNTGLDVLNFTVYPLVSPPDDSQVLGSTFSPAGKVIVAPLGDSIEFWDTATGTLRARLMTPEELNVFAYPEVSLAPQIALDPTGQTIFALSASGLTVLKLPEPADDLPAGPWSPSRRGPAQRHEFSGGIAARMAAMRNRQRTLKTISRPK